MKVVVSFTTSPCRISKIKIMIDSILNQTRKPDYFVLNIPKIFPRTGESYDIPEFIKDNDDITVNVIDRDYGPATKVIPTIQFIKEKNLDLSNTRIIYVDDDIKQLPNMISTFLKYSVDKNIILGTSGFIFKRSLQNNNEINAVALKNHLQHVSIIEGYGAVCLSPEVFRSDFMNYFNSLSNIKSCLLSDDVVLSNYYNKYNKCFVISTPDLNSIRMWNSGCILEYGNENDALHVNDGNAIKYGECIKHLKSKGILYFKIEQYRVMGMGMGGRTNVVTNGLGNAVKVWKKERKGNMNLLFTGNSINR